MKLWEENDDNYYIYERGYIIIKGYFFQETHQNKRHIYFQDYQPDAISCQCSILVCAMCIKLVEVQSRKKLKFKKWRMSKSDHERTIEARIALEYF